MLAMGILCFTKLSVDFRRFRVFVVFLPQSIFKSPKTTEGFSLLFFKGVKTFRVIIKLSKSFCVFRIEAWKYCSKLSMQTENWILKQLCSFAMPNSIDVPSWLHLSSFLVTKSLLVMSISWLRTVSVYFRRFRVFVFCRKRLCFISNTLFPTQPQCSFTFS